MIMIMIMIMMIMFIVQSVDGMTEPIDELAMTPESQQSAGETISPYSKLSLSFITNC